MTAVPTQLAAARLRAAAARPYYAAAIFALEPTRRPEDMEAPLAVDATGRILWSDDSLDEAVDVLAARLIHGLEHLLRDHASRGQSWVPSIGADGWTAACDLEIDDDLGDLPLPTDFLSPATFGLPEGRLAEWYASQFQAAPDPTPEADNPPSDDNAGEPAHWDGATTDEHLQYSTGSHSCLAAAPADGGAGEPGLSGARLDQLRRDAADAVSAHRGRVPAGIARWATDLSAARRIDWRSELIRRVRRVTRHQTGADVHDARRPSRRSPHPVLLPRLRGNVVRPTVVVDTSGSMSSDDLAGAVAQIDQLLRTVSTGEPIDVIACDADVHAVTRTRRATDIDLAGGGGSDMSPGIAAAVSSDADVIVVITDGWVGWPESRPRIPVIAALLGDHCPLDLVPDWISTLEIDEVEEGRR